MADIPEARESKAILRLSLHQLGAPVSGPLKEVTFTGSLPSAFATHISELPERVDWKVTRVASGEYCGTSCMRVDSTNAVPVSAGLVRSMRQMSVKRFSRTKATRLPTTLTPGPNASSVP